MFLLSFFGFVYIANVITIGLFNGNVLKAMADNGIKYAVGDNTVTNLVPANKYHGVCHSFVKPPYIHHGCRLLQLWHNMATAAYS